MNRPGSFVRRLGDHVAGIVVGRADCGLSVLWIDRQHPEPTESMLAGVGLVDEGTCYRLLLRATYMKRDELKRGALTV